MDPNLVAVTIEVSEPVVRAELAALESEYGDGHDRLLEGVVHQYRTIVSLINKKVTDDQSY